MAEADAAPGAANVVFELAGGEEITLVPTTGCIVRLCLLPGGLHSTIADQNTVHSRVSACDLPTMCEVIRAGCGVGQNADKALPDKIAKTGVFVVRSWLQIFVAICGNGGRPLGTPEKDEGDEGGEVEDKGLGERTA